MCLSQIQKFAEQQKKKNRITSIKHEYNQINAKWIVIAIAMNANEHKSATYVRSFIC